MRKALYIIQGDPRDHHGEILLVTVDKEKAMLFCKKKIIQWNKDFETLQIDAKTMKLPKFLDKYLGSAWISSPQMIRKWLTM